MAAAMPRDEEIDPNTNNVGSSAAVWLAGNRPSSRSDTGMTVITTDRAMAPTAVSRLPKRRDRGGAMNIAMIAPAKAWVIRISS